MFIETKTATLRVEDIQAAYNKAVMSGRMSLAREIEQLDWGFGQPARVARQQTTKQ